MAAKEAKGSAKDNAPAKGKPAEPGGAKRPKADAPAKTVKAKRSKKTDATNEAKPAKEPKAKLVRDSFTIPKLEYVAIDELKQRAARLGRPAKKSELLRAGLKVLSSMADEALLASLATVPAIKTGRPAKS